MRSIALLAALFGLALLTGLTLFYGLSAVMAAVASSRWATAFVVAVRAAALAGAGIGWWALVSARQPGPSSFVVLRFIREAINSFFPVAVIGGDVIGARLLARFGVIANFGCRQRADRHLRSTRLSILFRAGGAWHRAQSGRAAAGQCDCNRLVGHRGPGRGGIFSSFEFRRRRTAGAMAR